MGDPSLSYKGRTEAALLELSETSTDPIFESLTSQISRTQAETIGSDKKLEIGDFFITKHSNLGEYHVLFHYMGEDTRYILFKIFLFFHILNQNYYFL